MQHDSTKQQPRRLAAGQRLRAALAVSPLEQHWPKAPVDVLARRRLLRGSLLVQATQTAVAGFDLDGVL